MTAPAVKMGAWLVRPLITAACGCSPRWGVDVSRAFAAATVRAQVIKNC